MGSSLAMLRGWVQHNLETVNRKRSSSLLNRFFPLSKNLYNVNSGCNFHLILADILSILIFSVKVTTGGGGMVFA